MANRLDLYQNTSKSGVSTTMELRNSSTLVPVWKLSGVTSVSMTNPSGDGSDNVYTLSNGNTNITLNYTDVDTVSLNGASAAAKTSSAALFSDIKESLKKLGENVVVPVTTASSLTSTRIGYGDGGNLMTSSANLTWSGTVLGVTGQVDISTVARLIPLTVATLPASPTAGMIACVNNALTPVAGAVVTGGGTSDAIVCYLEASWRVMGAVV